MMQLRKELPEGHKDVPAQGRKGVHRRNPESDREAQRRQSPGGLSGFHKNLWSEKGTSSVSACKIRYWTSSGVASGEIIKTPRGDLNHLWES